MKRLGALVVAVALVGGAAWLNRTIHDDDTSGSDTPSTNRLRVVCASELAAACKQLGASLGNVVKVRTEPAGTTSAALVADPNPGFDLWLTSEPWPELTSVRAAAASAPPPRVGDPSTTLAAADLSVVARSAQIAGLRDRCNGAVTGACVLRDGASLGIAPTTETGALLWFAATLTGWPDLVDAGTGDIDANDEFVSGFLATKSRAETDPSPITTILTRPKFDAAVDLNAQRQLRDAANGAQFASVSFEPPVVARAIAVPAATATGRGAVKRIGRSKIVAAITSTGWSANSPAGASLPDAAVLDYLATRWSSR